MSVVLYLYVGRRGARLARRRLAARAHGTLCCLSKLKLQ